MNTNDYWNLFIETGAPEIYLLYAKQQKVEGQYVSNGPGDRPQSNRL